MVMNVIWTQSPGWLPVVLRINHSNGALWTELKLDKDCLWHRLSSKRNRPFMILYIFRINGRNRDVFLPFTFLLTGGSQSQAPGLFKGTTEFQQQMTSCWQPRKDALLCFISSCEYSNTWNRPLTGTWLIGRVCLACTNPGCKCKQGTKEQTKAWVTGLILYCF